MLLGVFVLEEDEPKKIIITESEQMIIDYAIEHPIHKLKDITEGTKLGSSTVSRLVTKLKDKGVITKKFHVDESGEVDGRAIRIEVIKYAKRAEDK